jgi:hypothetical protein
VTRAVGSPGSAFRDVDPDLVGAPGPSRAPPRCVTSSSRHVTRPTHVGPRWTGGGVVGLDGPDGTRRARGQAYLAGLMALVLLTAMGAVVTLIAVVLRSTFLVDGLSG